MNIKLILSYYWPHMKKYPRSGILLFVAYGIGIIFSEVGSPLLAKEIIDTITTFSNEPMAARDNLFSLMMLLGAFILIYNIFYRFGDYFMVYHQSNVLRELTNSTFESLHKHSYTFFANNFAGALVTKAKRYINSFETLHDKFVFMGFFGGLKLISALVVLLWFVPYVGIFFLVWLIFYCILIYYFVKKKIPKDLAEANADSHVTAKYADAITNSLTIKMFSAYRHETTIFRKSAQHQESKRRIAWNLDNLQKLVQGFLFGFLEFATMFIALKLWLAGNISVGTVVLVQIYLAIAFDVVWNLGRTFTESAKAVADAKEMIDIFEQKPDVRDPQHPERCRITDGKIIFDNMHFSYGTGNNVFDDFSLTINASDRIGLVGHSGAGKTTITKLLLRFTNIDGGTITIDGQNISLITQSDLRRKIAYVPQEPLLFHRSLRDNIAYSNPGASDDEVIAAAKKANAHDFIEKLHDGYDTLVGERGIKLSGGERQRVAIARAMLKNAPILILDEATSSLDSTSEKMIQEAFEKLMEGRTTIVIAHRLSTIQKMDRIIVLDAGKIAEEGTHDELLAKNGHYATFWKQQTGGYLGD